MTRYLLSAAIITCTLLHGQPAQSPEVITKVKRSTPKARGQSREYSEWYVLESDPAPAGYHVADVQFKLEGGNSCGVNAQCLEGERTPLQSTWLFRIQGLGEDHGAGPVVAVLTTTYRKTGAETSYTATVTTTEKFSSRGEYFGCFDTPDAATDSDGPWCFLSAARPKPGYRIKSESFSLQGDRSCVGNDSDRQPDEPTAWCRLVTRTDDEAVWQFKMLGHVRDGSDIAASSFGKLTIVYEKKP